MASESEQPPLVAHIIYRLGVGGLENGLVNLINSIPENCYRHAVICMAGYTDYSTRILREDVQIFDLEKKPGKDLGFYFRLFRLLRRLQPQIVHTRNIAALDCQFVAMAAGADYRIHGEHGWDVSDLNGARRIHVLLRRMSQCFVHHYTTVSKHMAEWLENTIGIATNRVTQVYNGVDTARFTPRVNETSPVSAVNQVTDAVVIGTVSRLDPIKDHITLLRAFESSVNRLPELPGLRLVIVGAGETKQDLERFVTERQLDRQVTFSGESGDIPSLMKSFDLFVLSSLNEGISNTILEAMATGLPVIASAVGGNPELVQQNVTGSLFQPGDDDALASLICRYVSRPHLLRDHGNAGRARVVEEFGLRTMVEEYLALYNQGAKRKRVPWRTTG